MKDSKMLSDAANAGPADATLTVRLPRRLIEAAREDRSKTGVSISWRVRQALVQQLGLTDTARAA
jgi:LDH2 family malate/lactate/ureidoglycolate dehydrogenase